jgi:hypothetical protein
MEKQMARAGILLMTAGSLAVASFSLRYFAVLRGHWPLIDGGIRGVIEQFPLRALTHLLVAPIALLVGPLQFMPSLRARHRQVHRIFGRVYVAACVIAGAGGLATALHASGGPIAGGGFAALAVCWIGTTLGAWRAAVQRRLALHRLLMRLSYAMTFGAVTLRLQIPVGFALGYSSYSQMSVWLAYTSWVPNVVIVALYSLYERRCGASHAARNSPTAGATDGGKSSRSTSSSPACTRGGPLSPKSFLQRAAPSAAPRVRGLTDYAME